MPQCPLLNTNLERHCGREFFSTLFSPFLFSNLHSFYATACGYIIWRHDRIYGPGPGDEQAAHLKLKRLKEVLESTIKQFNGKILQYYGDGSLSIFSSAIDCVCCAINMQRQLQQQPKNAA
jgi:hypothetical protein